MLLNAKIKNHKANLLPLQIDTIVKKVCKQGKIKNWKMRLSQTFVFSNFLAQKLILAKTAHNKKINL
jgi:hypothetical protein